MTVVEVLGSVDELADGMGGSVDAVTGAAIGPYRKSRVITGGQDVQEGGQVQWPLRVDMKDT
jgi:predicted nucleotidyltransferase